MISDGADMEKREPCALLVGLYIDTAIIENGVQVPQKIKMEWPYYPAIKLLGIYSYVQRN